MTKKSKTYFRSLSTFSRMQIEHNKSQIMFIIVIKWSQIEGVRNKANQQSIVLHFSLGLAPDDSFFVLAERAELKNSWIPPTQIRLPKYA